MISIAQVRSKKTLNKHKNNKQVTERVTCESCSQYTWCLESERMYVCRDYSPRLTDGEKKRLFWEAQKRVRIKGEEI